MPSSKTPVTFSFRYLLAGAPCGAALVGMGDGAGAAGAAGLLSGGWVPVRTGVEIRAEGVVAPATWFADGWLFIRLARVGVDLVARTVFVRV